MATVVTAPAQSSQRMRRTRLWLAVLIAVLILLVLAVFVVSAVPFTQERVIRKLQEATDSRVTVREFRHTYFPEPGCVLSGVVFKHESNASKPLMTIDKLSIRSLYFEILAGHVSLMQAEGLRISIPAIGTGVPFHTQATTLRLGEIVANGATLEIALHDPQKAPLKFDIDQATLNGVQSGRPFTYYLKVHNPEPPGEVMVNGKYGAWNDNDPAQTPVSGKYTFENADLSVYRGIAGTLSSSGEFSGTLGHINISGTTDAPAFMVTLGGHPVHLTSAFSADVDAIRGDTFLKRVDARFRKTHVVAEGSVAGSPKGHGKTAQLSMSVAGGRIEDVLGLFVKKERPPMSGRLDLRAKVEIPSGAEEFLRRVKMDGMFGIAGGEFGEPSTQEGVNKLSAGALGEKDTSDPETALTDLKGRVLLSDGLANFSDLSFGVPGAKARMHGTYSILSYKIDLHGQMRVETKISNTSSGVKAFLLRVMDPFFKKRKKGEVLPVKITGTYEKPLFGLDLMDKKAQVVKPAHESSRR